MFYSVVLDTWELNMALNSCGKNFTSGTSVHRSAVHSKHVKLKCIKADYLPMLLWGEWLTADRSRQDGDWIVKGTRGKHCIEDGSLLS